MNFPIRLHPDVVKYLNSLESSDRKRCMHSIKLLGKNPYQGKPMCDIKKLKGKKRDMFRLRIGDRRFEYFIEDRVIWVVDAFKRGRGYR